MMKGFTRGGGGARNRRQALVFNRAFRLCLVSWAIATYPASAVANTEIAEFEQD